jgi:hypothetical protein
MVWASTASATNFSVVLHDEYNGVEYTVHLLADTGSNNEKLPVNLVPAKFLTRSLFNVLSKAICNLFANLFFGLLAQVIALLIGICCFSNKYTALMSKIKN